MDVPVTISGLIDTVSEQEVKIHALENSIAQTDKLLWAQQDAILDLGKKFKDLNNPFSRYMVEAAMENSRINLLEKQLEELKETIDNSKSITEMKLRDLYRMSDALRSKLYEDVEEHDDKLINQERRIEDLEKKIRGTVNPVSVDLASDIITVHLPCLETFMKNKDREIIFVFTHTTAVYDDNGLLRGVYEAGKKIKVYPVLFFDDFRGGRRIKEHSWVIKNEN